MPEVFYHMLRPAQIVARRKECPVAYVPIGTIEWLVGAGGRLAPQDAAAEFGRETLQASANAALKEVRHRLEHPGLCRRHGHCLDEGLWRE